jgi:hypothetical protein
LRDQHHALATNHRPQGLYHFEIRTDSQEPLVPVKMRSEKRADAPHKCGITSPDIGVCALREFLAFLNRLFLLGREKDSPTLIRIPAVHHPAVRSI